MVGVLRLLVSRRRLLFMAFQRRRQMELARLLLFLLLLFSFLEFQGRPGEKVAEAVTGFLLERFLRDS